jgi:hypothetical protein
MRNRSVAPVLLLILTAGLLAFISITTNNTLATPQATLTLNVTEISEGNDFATRVLAIPWDMNGQPYPDFPTTFKNINRSLFIADGDTWTMSATNIDPNLWLLWSSIIDTQEVLRLGDKYPIDSSLYKLLSFQLCNNSTVNEFANVYWMYDKSPHLNPNNGVSKFFTTPPGCNIYVLDLDQSANFQGSWTGQPKAFRVDLATSQTNFKMDWVRLTTRDTSNIVPITWTGVTPNSTMYFYLSDTACGSNGYLVGTASANSSGNGTFNWGSALQTDTSQSSQNGARLPIPESFEPGDYHVYALDNNTGSPICASGTLKIHRAPLLTEFHSPSTYSGPDYATQVLGDAWGMNNSQDVASTNGIQSFSFNNGVLDMLTVVPDPQIYLRVGAPINTNEYKYATFRYLLDGTQDIGQGWVHRFIWWYVNPQFDAVTTEDMILYEGWKQYSFDLSTALIEGGFGSWSGAPTVFRFDPIELPVPSTAHLDFVLITGDNIAKQGSVFEINYSTMPETGVTVSLYYDKDKNPNNGRTLISAGTSLARLLDSGNQYFLPLIKNELPPPEVDLLTGISRYWNTTGVPPDTYYISADVSDGFMTTTWYSEVPITIVP